ncbi:unnamed protein product [Brachionus calyciflorus]|uniref:Uncharacterized protein n=1 Tax=Brachionus calyciflorus TaxID=104777 RepID=A0A814AMX6_9BILA|nr:unnamed protein product [Brachionus calyciflorus]
MCSENAINLFEIYLFIGQFSVLQIDQINTLPFLVYNSLIKADFKSLVANVRETADKISKQQINKLRETKKGDTVQVPVSEAYSCPVNHPNILAYIL